MSDYVRTKGVIYPIEQELLDKLGLKDAWDLESKAESLFGYAINTFSIECFLDYDGDDEARYYLIYQTAKDYGRYGDFGRSRFLSQPEQEKYIEIFKQVLPEVDRSKLKYIDYCYYNCCEAPDYYIRPDAADKEEL